jgi:hypothetical protein
LPVHTETVAVQFTDAKGVVTQAEALPGGCVIAVTATETLQ